MPFKAMTVGSLEIKSDLCQTLGFSLCVLLQARIYHCIQYTDLHQLAPPQIPDILMEAQQMYGVSEFRTVRKGKKWSTFSGSITKPTIKSLKMHKQVLYGKE